MSDFRTLLVSVNKIITVMWIVLYPSKSHYLPAVRFNDTSDSLTPLICSICFLTTRRCFMECKVAPIFMIIRFLPINLRFKVLANFLSFVNPVTQIRLLLLVSKRFHSCWKWATSAKMSNSNQINDKFETEKILQNFAKISFRKGVILNFLWRFVFANWIFLQFLGELALSQGT